MKSGKRLEKTLTWFGKSTIPSKYIVSLENYFSKAGLTSIPFVLITEVFIAATIAAIILFFAFASPKLPSSMLATFLITMPLFIVVELVVLLAAVGMLYYYFNMKIFRRTLEIERVLPDFLDNLKLNISEGMSFEKALIQSVEPEFGVLANEIEIVSKRSMTGVPAEKALLEFSRKYNSNVLKEAVDVLVIAMKEGADIVETIDKIVESMRTGKYLIETVRAGVSGFIIFITLVSLVVAPMLYALSLNLLFIFKSFADKLGGATASFFSIRTENLVSEQTFVTFSRFSIAVVAFFSALIISNLKEGSLKAAAKTIIIFIGLSLVVYEIARLVLNLVFGSII